MRGTGGLVLGIAASLAAFGCGGGGGSTTAQTVTDQTGSLSKSQFIAQEDAICKRYNAQITPVEDKFKKLQAGGFSGSEQSAGANLLRQDAAIAHQETAALRQPQPPPEDATVIKDWLASGEGTVPLANRIADALESGDSASLHSLAEQLNSHGTKTLRIAHGYGFKVCGQG